MRRVSKTSEKTINALTFKLILVPVEKDFPGGASGKEHACQCIRHKTREFNPWFKKIPWRRAWQHNPIFLPRESEGLRSLMGYSPQGGKESTQLKRIIMHVEEKERKKRVRKYLRRLQLKSSLIWEGKQPPKSRKSRVPYSISPKENMPRQK